MALSAGSWMEKIYQAKANFFFLKYTGELCIIADEEQNIYKTPHTHSTPEPNILAREKRLNTLDQNTTKHTMM